MMIEQAENERRLSPDQLWELRDWKDRKTQSPDKTIQHYFALDLLDNNHFLTFSDTKEVYKWNDETGLYEPAENYLHEQTQAFFEKYTTTHLTNEIANTVRRYTFAERQETINSSLIPLQNGFYDLKEKQFKAFTPEVPFFTKHPVEYDPLAICPNINKFLFEVAENDTEKTWVLNRIAAYCLYRDYPFQKAFMLYGGGSNGKSVYLSLLIRMLGHQNVTQIPLQELVEEKFARSRLYQKNANVFADLESRALKSTGIFKALTGGDYITCDRKYMDPFDFKNHAKLIFSCNQLPRVNDESDAFFRRWVIIPFTRQFEWKDQDNFLVEKITSPGELSGFVNQCLGELSQLLETREFGIQNEHDIKQIRELYLRLSDSAKFFFYEMLAPSAISQLTKEEIWKGYIEFCSKQKLPAQTDKGFWKALYFHYEGKAYESRPLMDGERVRVIVGVDWRSRLEGDKSAKT